jgi:Protein of unknown function (DUF2924).
MLDASLQQRLASLPDLSKPALCSLWLQLFKNEPPPKARREIMLRVIAYRLQEREFGGLSDAQCRRLRQLSSALKANPNATVSTRPLIKPGTRLLRQWKDRVHVVEVAPDGYQYKGARYDSLSEIARLITGTRWSGPLFFGLKSKPVTDSKEAQ